MVEVEPAPSPAPRIEYRQSNNKKTAINKYFFVQHLNGLPTDKRQCIRCKHIVTACNGGTSNMRKHYILLLLSLYLTHQLKIHLKNGLMIMILLGLFLIHMVMIMFFAKKSITSFRNSLTLSSLPLSTHM